MGPGDLHQKQNAYVVRAQPWPVTAYQRLALNDTKLSVQRIAIADWSKTYIGKLPFGLTFCAFDDAYRWIELCLDDIVQAQPTTLWPSSFRLIIWANVDADLFRHMASLGHAQLMQKLCTMQEESMCVGVCVGVGVCVCTPSPVAPLS